MCSYAKKLSLNKVEFPVICTKHERVFNRLYQCGLDLSGDDVLFFNERIQI